MNAAPADAATIERIARRYEGRWLQGYVRGKLRSDPVYRAVAGVLADSALPVLDAGCGVGLLAGWLREGGLRMPVAGWDTDGQKIALAKAAGRSLEKVSFAVGDVTEQRGFEGHVVILDLLHYLDRATQERFLRQIAGGLPERGVCVIRVTLRDGSWRFALTRVEERFMRAVRWMRARVSHYPSRDELCAPFAAAGFACEARPLWGRTPFNSHLFVFRR